MMMKVKALGTRLKRPKIWRERKMADEESELYLENLDEFVNDEDKIVSQFSFLIREFKIIMLGPPSKALVFLFSLV